MYWSPKICKTPIGATFIVASKNRVLSLCLMLFLNISKIFDHVENFHIKNYFTHTLKSSGLYKIHESSIPIFAKLNKINTKKKAKSISSFEFTTLYTTIPHDLLIKM